MNEIVTICSTLIVTLRRVNLKFSTLHFQFSIHMTKKTRCRPGLNSKQENRELINVEIVFDRLCDRLRNAVDLFGFKPDLVGRRNSFLG
jgi:hypothetical protein